MMHQVGQMVKSFIVQLSFILSAIGILDGKETIRDTAGSVQIKTDTTLIAGFRASRILSSYPGNTFPEPQYWQRVGEEMANKFSTFESGGVWIVSLYLSSPEGYTLLNFPSLGGNVNWIYFKNTDENERYFSHFDTTGIKVWLQVEPGGADIDTLIHLVLNRYKHHPCVAGFGIDVEWYQTYAYTGGHKVTDQEAEHWEQKVKAVNQDYTLFLKHYGQSWMPPTYRGNLIFIDDSQGFTGFGNPFTSMVNEFKNWGAKYYPNPVGFQFGYPADRSWWGQLEDPAQQIGDGLITNIPNCSGLFWVDFTITELFPITQIENDIRIPSDFIVFQNYPNPFNSATTFKFQLPEISDVEITILDANGRQIKTWDQRQMPAGLHTFQFRANRYASGLYFYQIQTNTSIMTKKMILIK